MVNPFRTDIALWAEMGDIFKEADDDLPEIVLAGTPASEAAAVWDHLRHNSRFLLAEPTASTKAGSDVWLADLDDPVGDVRADRLYEIHVVLTGLTHENEPIPDLGVRIGSADLTLDYRAGPEWHPTNLAALIDLLGVLQNLAPTAKLQIADAAGQIAPPEQQQRFTAAVQGWLER